MQHRSRTLLILLILAVGGVASLGWLAHRYSRLLDGRLGRPEGAAERVDAFIEVRLAMRREIDSWEGGPSRPEALILARDRALSLRGIDGQGYAATRGLYRAWRQGRLRPGTRIAAAFESRREDLRRCDLGGYERLDS